MGQKFVFRGQECCYEYYWSGDDEFHFCFNQMGDKDFVDSDGDEYFIHCQYYKDYAEDDNELCPPWYFERWYEHESLNACDYFDDKLTEAEIDYIKEFMLVAMK